MNHPALLLPVMNFLPTVAFCLVLFVALIVMMSPPPPSTAGDDRD